MKTLFASFLLLLFQMINLNALELRAVHAGKSEGYEWSIHQIIPSDSNKISLIFVIKNTGYKWIDLNKINISNFKLTNSKGDSIKLLRASNFSGISLHSASVCQIDVQGPLPSSERYTLNLSSSDTFVKVSLSAGNLQFGNSR